jgi:hypothetical protein
MEKPIVVERFADNGAFSHYALIGSEGDLLWSEAPEEELQKVVKENELLNGVSNSVCSHPQYDILGCPYGNQECEKCNYLHGLVKKEK